MESLFEIAIRLKNQLPIEVKHERWGNLVITLDLVENVKRCNRIHHSGEAYTLSENYDALRGTKGKYKLIGSSHLKKWYIKSEYDVLLAEHLKEQKEFRELELKKMIKRANKNEKQ